MVIYRHFKCLGFAFWPCARNNWQSVNNFGFGCTAGALNTIYNGLGLKSPNTAVPIPLNTVGPFFNLQPYLYWSQTSTNALGYGTFSFNSGFHGSNTVPNYLYVLPMIPGKIPGTPAANGIGLQVNPGGQTVYDPVMNVTWLTNANLGASNTFSLPPCTGAGIPKLCVDADGAMNWNSAAQYITNMNAFNGTGYLGQSNWQLATMDPACSILYACVSAADPLGGLYYGQLGFIAGTPVVATPNVAVGPFRHVQPYLYWSCQGLTSQDACSSAGPSAGFEWTFSFGNGFLGTDLLKNEFYVLPYYPDPLNPATALAIEYYDAAQDHYFISDLQPDITALDNGKFPGWIRTGATILVYTQPSGAASPVCRFYIPPTYGDSHFYSAVPAECAEVSARFPFFVEEAPNVFYVDVPDPVTGACPPGDIPVYRVWDNRADTNHRYTTSTGVVDQMRATGWVPEGYGPGPYLPIMCGPQ